jgi:hypothetical protein
MDIPLRDVTRDPVVLWQQGVATCICQHVTADRIEIQLVIADVTIQRSQFSDVDAAAQFALDKMRAYNGG